MRILAIDPGPEKSAILRYDYIVSTPRGCPSEFGIQSNKDIIIRLKASIYQDMVDLLAIEMVACYGMPVGREVFETCVWIGRFIQAWGKDYKLVYRREVKLYLCGSMHAKDSNIRQALLDRFGGKEKAIGKKQTPGPLYGISKDVWSALAIAVTAAKETAE